MSFNFRAPNPRSLEFDRAIDSAASLLGDMRVVRALGTASGRYLNILGSLYMGKLKDGRIVTPRDHMKDTSISFFPLSKGESVKPSSTMATLHASQIAKIDDFLSMDEKKSTEKNEILTRIKQQLKSVSSESEPVQLKSVKTEDDIRPRTESIRAELIISNEVYEVQSRPSIYSALAHSDTFRAVGLTLLHQVAHADIALTKGPTLVASKTLKDGRHEEDHIQDQDNKIALASVIRREY